MSEQDALDNALAQCILVFVRRGRAIREAQRTNSDEALPEETVACSSPSSAETSSDGTALPSP